MEIIAAKEQFLLRINVTTAEDAEGNYTCVASNRVGTDSAFSLLRSGIGEFSECSGVEGALPCGAYLCHSTSLIGPE